MVREKDFTDFLSKAGIYENAYNVVLQGDIVRFMKIRQRELRLLMDKMEVQMEKLRKELQRLELYKRLEEERRNCEIKLNLKLAYETKKSIDTLEENIRHRESELQSLRENLQAYEARYRISEEELIKVNESPLPFREKVGRLSQAIKNITQSMQSFASRIEELKREGERTY